MSSMFHVGFHLVRVQNEVRIHLQRYEDVRHHPEPQLNERCVLNRFVQVHHDASHHMLERRGQRFSGRVFHFLSAHHLDTSQIHVFCPLRDEREWFSRYEILARVLRSQEFQLHPSLLV